MEWRFEIHDRIREKLCTDGPWKMSQNSGHTKSRSTIERRCVQRHPHPNPLPEGIGVNFVDDIT